MTIKVKKLHPDAVLPKYAHGPECDAGMDLHAVEEVILCPGIPALVKTGLSIELPPGYEAQIRPRSGLALKHGISIPNSPATIDPSYRGEVGVILLWGGHHPTHIHYDGRAIDFEAADDAQGTFYESLGFTSQQVEELKRRSMEISLRNCGVFRISPGDRIAQMVIARYESVEWEESELSESARGANGFGSTGTSDAIRRHDARMKEAKR